MMMMLPKTNSWTAFGGLYRWAAAPQMMILLVLLLFSSHCVTSFNVDVNSKVIHEGPRKSCDGDCMFGFSVAQHKEQGQPW
jgi:hypothetical protein